MEDNYFKYCVDFWHTTTWTQPPTCVIFNFLMSLPKDSQIFAFLTIYFTVLMLLHIFISLVIAKLPPLSLKYFLNDNILIVKLQILLWTFSQIKMCINLRWIFSLTPPTPLLSTFLPQISSPASLGEYLYSVTKISFKPHLLIYGRVIHLLYLL